MRRPPTLTLIALLTLFALPLGGCGEPSDELREVGREMGDTWDAVKRYAAMKKDEAMAFFGKNLDLMGKRLAAARERAAEMGEDASAALDSKWSDVQAKYAEMKDATGEQWERARDAFAAAYEAFVREMEGQESSGGATR
jgi:hypothetical protein